MNKELKSGLLRLAVWVFLLTTGCGREGGGDSSYIPPTATVVKLYLKGTPTGGQIGGAQVTLHLAPGVSVKATQNPPQTDPGVVTASGGAADGNLDLSTYSPSAGTVTVHVVKAEGFDVGEFAIVNCEIASGYSPQAAQFSVSDSTIWDLNGNDNSITTVQANLAVTFN